jgi:hypothetical protein
LYIRKSLGVGAAIVVALSATGCTTSQTAFLKNPDAIDTTSLCRTLNTSTDPVFRQQIVGELSSRSVTLAECARRVQNQNQAIAVGVAIAAVGVAAAVCANNDCGGGYTGAGYYQGADWDQFYGQYGQLVWACREIGSGRFTYDYECAGKPQTDFRWPSKRA